MSASICKSGVFHPKRGRPRNEVGITRIKLKKDVFDTWLSRKDSLGFSRTHSELAMCLLLNLCEEERGESNFIPTSTNGKRKTLLTHCMFLHELRLYTVILRNLYHSLLCYLYMSI